MRRFALLAAVIAFAVLGCGAARETGHSYRVIAATDLHYLSPALTDHGAYFTALTENADGKLMRYIEEITDAFLEEAAREKPEALILTGDLSFNGALRSHEALAEKLQRLENKGVPVLVLPGNHDLDNPNAASFEGDGFRRVESASAEDFCRVYASFGFDEALSRDPDSLSYVYPLNASTRVLMLDFNTRHDPCGVSGATLAWARGALEDARRAGASVLAAGHQNLYQQTMFRAGYVVDGSTELAALLREFDVPLFLSGHLHCQHWMNVAGLTEIAGSALSVSPCQYGVLRAEDGAIRYETRAVDVATWAESHGETDPALLDFPAYAEGFFDARTRSQLSELLALFPYTYEEAARMTDYMTEINRAFFSGDLRDAASLDPDGRIYALWEKYPTPWLAYLSTIRPDFGRDFRVWEWTRE